MKISSTIDPNQLATDVRFEQHYAEVLAFVQKKGHASCFEMMKEFHISYADSVHLMDTLEERGIVDITLPGETGGRTLLNGKKKRCLPPVINATPTSPLAEAAPSVALPAAPSAEAKPTLTTTRKRTAVRKSAKPR